MSGRLNQRRDGADEAATKPETHHSCFEGATTFESWLSLFVGQSVASSCRAECDVMD